MNPITNGQYTDSTPRDIEVMRRRSHVLHKLLDGVVQRQDYAVLEPYLPPKHEYVIFIKPSELQVGITPLEPSQIYCLVVVQAVQTLHGTFGTQERKRF